MTAAGHALGRSPRDKVADVVTPQQGDPVDSARTLDDQRALGPELNPGEQLRWVGHPAPSRFAVRALPKAVFGIPFAAFAVFWVSMAFNMSSQVEKAPEGFAVFFPWFGVPFVLVGLAMMASPLWELRKGALTVYAVTSERALILEQHLGRRLRSYRPETFTGIERSGSSENRGDVIFRTEHVRGSEGERRARTIGFFGIEDARRVEREILRLQERHRG